MLCNRGGRGKQNDTRRQRQQWRRQVPDCGVVTQLLLPLRHAFVHYGKVSVAISQQKAISTNEYNTKNIKNENSNERGPVTKFEATECLNTRACECQTQTVDNRIKPVVTHWQQNQITNARVLRHSFLHWPPAGPRHNPHPPASAPFSAANTSKMHDSLFTTQSAASCGSNESIVLQTDEESHK